MTDDQRKTKGAGNLFRAAFKLTQPLLARYYRYQTSKKRVYKYRGIKVVVPPGVFHPKFTFSTKVFVKHIQLLDLKDKKVLELGCGSGLISMHAAAKGALVTATDINPQALEGVRESAALNGLDVATVHSDLFEKVKPNDFDYILINPPYYPKAPANMSENAWYCGQDFEYFTQLFSQLGRETATTLMILSDDCDIEKIRSIATQKGFELHMVAQKQVMTERNWIFELKNAGRKEEKIA